MPAPVYTQTEGAKAFSAFLVAHDLSDIEAGRRLSVSGVTVYHWKIGAKIPAPLNRQKIEVFTRGVNDSGQTIKAGIAPSAWGSDEEMERELAAVVPFELAQKLEAAPGAP